jgi:hypothetical protein
MATLLRKCGSPSWRTWCLPESQPANSANVSLAIDRVTQAISASSSGEALNVLMNAIIQAWTACLQRESID